jgi:hypothetical protein
MGLRGQQTWYEWDVETIDQYGDVQDHNHANHLSDLCHSLASDEELVLVYNTGNDLDGVEDRQWAYVSDGVLPDEFSGGQRVPQSCKREFAKHHFTGGRREQ